MIHHPFPPLYDENSKILILGSFPSVKSREQNFFYGHPRNRFWKVVAGVLQCPVPATVEEKREMLLQNGIALWDVIGSCEITGSADSTIKNVRPNDLSKILDNASIRQIFVNGKTAEKIFIQKVYKFSKCKPYCLPSTSPANAAWSLERLMEAWSAILQYL